MSIGIELPPPPPPPPSTPTPLAAQADAEFELAAADPQVADAPERTCPNCGAPVHGPFCYACGQTEKGMIRHLSEVVSEFADIVLNVDSRVFRSLWDLYLRPGFLTNEYLAGRRARYVTPFRLFFFLTIVAFFAMQAAIPTEALIFEGDDDVIANATNAAEVDAAVSEAVEGINLALAAPGIDGIARETLDEAAHDVREKGEERQQEIKQELKDEAAAIARGESIPPKKPKGLDFNIGDLNGKPWHATTNPLHLDWLPEFANAELNSTLDHIQKNVQGAKEDPGRLVAGYFGVLPQTLFVVMPLFAVLLKVFYVFKRRLYMEHLLVALHSHAFIFMSVLIIMLLSFLGDLAIDVAWLSVPLNVLRACAWIWLFVYLLIMQKRVYRQGWIMSVVKYGVVGFCYSIVLVLALSVALVVSLAVT